MHNSKILYFIFSASLCVVLIASCAKKLTNESAQNVGQAKDNSVTQSYVIKEADFAFNFYKSDELSPVLDKATDKLVFVDINAKWCVPCKLMQRDVYTHKETAAFFNEHFINYMVDADTLEGPDLRLIYEITTIPTLLWLDNKGKVVHKKEGACYHAELIRNAEIALQANKK